MYSLFFDPQGRISPARFWRGYTIILGIYIILQCLTVLLGQGPTTTLLGFLSVVLYWNTAVIYTKRLHDAGYTGFWVAAIALGWFTAAMIVIGATSMIFAGDIFMRAMEDTDYANSQSFLVALQDAIFVPSTAALLAVNIAIGFILAGLNSDPGSNTYGPPTVRSVADEF